MKKIILVALLFLVQSSIAAEALLIFGGKDRSIFLGVLNASKYDSGSIWNNYGEHGSKYSDKCIWNNYGEYGGKYSEGSPFNPYSSNPPVIVDKEGNFYGYFTASTSNPKKTRVKLALYILENWEKISEDPGKHYSLLFE